MRADNIRRTVTRIESWHQLPRSTRKILARKRIRDLRKPIKPDYSLEQMLTLLSVKNLRFMAKKLDVPISHHKKDSIIKTLAQALRNSQLISSIWGNLAPADREVFLLALKNGGCIEYDTIVKKFGTEDYDSPYWYHLEPKSSVGVLRIHGLIYTGEMVLNGWLKIVICIPPSIQEIAKELLD